MGFNSAFKGLKPSGSTLLNTRFNIKKLFIVFTLPLCVLYRSQGNTATFALYSNRLVVYNRGGESVYCAVWTVSLHVKQTSFIFKGLIEASVPNIKSTIILTLLAPGV
jgi:hypothetical protein